MWFNKDLSDITKELAKRIQNEGIEALLPTILLSDTLSYIMEDELDPSIYKSWAFLAAQATLWLLEEIMKQLSDDLIARMAYPDELRSDTGAYEILPPYEVAALTGLILSEQNPAVKEYNADTGRVVWNSAMEQEYIAYLEESAIDFEHAKWMQYLYTNIYRVSEWTNRVDSDLKKECGVSLKELVQCIEILEFWMKNPEKMSQFDSKIPLWRLDSELLLSPLSKKIGPGRARKVLRLLSWNRSQSISKFPLIHLRGKSYLFAYWFCKAVPSLMQYWFYPYFYHGHARISGLSGTFRGGIFEDYLKERIDDIVGEPVTKLREPFGETDIDLVVNLDGIGLIIDAKGGTLELPKSLEDIRWRTITSDDVFNRFDENKENSSSWDATFEELEEDNDWVKRVGLSNCEKLIPIIVHSKKQPIMIASYRNKYDCPDYITETHSIETLLKKVNEYLSTQEW